MVEEPVCLVPLSRSAVSKPGDQEAGDVVAVLPESWITKFVPDNDDDINPKSCYDDLKHENFRKGALHGAHEQPRARRPKAT